MVEGVERSVPLSVATGTRNVKLPLPVVSKTDDVTIVDACVCSCVAVTNDELCGTFQDLGALAVAVLMTPPSLVAITNSDSAVALEV